ncbi:MAG: hypothetical protein AAFR93_17175 [Pseudomonadota bacterium]
MRALAYLGAVIALAGCAATDAGQSGEAARSYTLAISDSSPFRETVVLRGPDGLVCEGAGYADFNGQLKGKGMCNSGQPWTYHLRYVGQDRHGPFNVFRPTFPSPRVTRVTVAGEEVAVRARPRISFGLALSFSSELPKVHH